MEQPTNVRPISADFADRTGQELERRQHFPTAQLERMIADAHQTIAGLAEKAELIKAAHVIAADKIEEAFKAADDADKAEIDDLRKRIDVLAEQRSSRARATEAKTAKAEADVEEQLSALDRMKEAQQAMLATLAKDVTPVDSSGLDMRTFATRKRKPKAA